MNSRSPHLLGAFACGLGCAWPAAAQYIQVNWDVAAGDSGDWHAAASWDPMTVPNNTATELYEVRFPADRRVTMSAGATVSILQSAGNLTLESNGSNLTIEETLNHPAGVFYLDKRQQLLVQAAATARFGGLLTLNDNAAVVNHGTLTVGARLVSSVSDLARDLPDVLNAKGGTVRLEVPDDAEFSNNFVTHNSGRFVILANQLESTKTFAQLDEEAVITVHGNATLKSKDLNLSLGYVRGNGTYEGGQGTGLTLGDGTHAATVEPGLEPGLVGGLTFEGNLNSVEGATFRFDLNGVEAGVSHDQLLVSTDKSLDLTEVTLDILLGYTPSGSDFFDIITGDLPINGVFKNEENGRVTFEQGSFAVVRTTQRKGDTDYYYIRLDDFAAVPEPSAWAGVAALGLLGLAGWRSARRDRAS